MNNKHFILFIISIFLVQNSFEQISTVTGTVINETGNPVPAAMVSEFRSVSASATYTDTLGFFSLPLSPYPKLKITCAGYNDTLVNVTDKSNIVIILSKAKTVKHSNVAAGNVPDQQLINKNLLEDAVATQTGKNNTYVYGGGVRNYTGSLLPVFTHKEETKGSRYLFNQWAHGSVVNANNTIFNNPAYLYNYDKIQGGLLLTSDKQSAIEADRTQIRSFTIYVDKDDPSVFENVPAIDNSHYVQVISEGNKYKIYKLTKTKFIKSDYRSDGIATSGNPYDEYIDEDSYFALTVQNNQIQKLSIKKKSIKEVFASEGEKLNKFISENSTDAMNDTFLKKLGDFLNN